MLFYTKVLLLFFLLTQVTSYAGESVLGQMTIDYQIQSSLFRNSRLEVDFATRGTTKFFLKKEIENSVLECKKRLLNEDQIRSAINFHDKYLREIVIVNPKVKWNDGREHNLVGLYLSNDIARLKSGNVYDPKNLEAIKIHSVLSDYCHSFISEAFR